MKEAIECPQGEPLLDYVTGCKGKVIKQPGCLYTGEVSKDSLRKLTAVHGAITTVVIPERAGDNYHVGYFKQVDRPLMGAYLSQDDEVAKKEMLLNALFVDGSRKLLEDDDLFFSLCLEAAAMVAFPKGVSVRQ